MTRVFAKRGVLAGLFAGLAVGLAVTPARAMKEGFPGELRVDDRAKVFTPEGVRKAEEAFRGTQFKSPTTMTVVTFKDIPEGRRPEYEKARQAGGEELDRFFTTWARDVAKIENVRGVFVLVSLEGGKVRAIDDRQTRDREFDAPKLREVQGRFAEKFAAARKNEADAARLRDEGLLNAVTYVAGELKDTAAPVVEGTGGSHDASGAEEAGGGGGGGMFGGLPLMSCCCLAVVAGLAIWLVVALIRAFTGGGGMGGGGYGGGGGFFPSLLGGLFGGMAGMWLYDSFFGGSSVAGADQAADTGADGGGHDDAGGRDDGAGDYDAGGDAGGGGDFGGGDFGGGDFGGD